MVHRHLYDTARWAKHVELVEPGATASQRQPGNHNQAILIWIGIPKFHFYNFDGGLDFNHVQSLFATNGEGAGYSPIDQDGVGLPGYQVCAQVDLTLVLAVDGGAGTGSAGTELVTVTDIVSPRIEVMYSLNLAQPPGKPETMRMV